MVTEQTTGEPNSWMFEDDDELEDADCLEDQLDILLRRADDERRNRDCLNCGRCESCINRSIAAMEEHEHGGM